MREIYLLINCRSSTHTHKHPKNSLTCTHTSFFLSNTQISHRNRHSKALSVYVTHFKRNYKYYELVFFILCPSYAFTRYISDLEWTLCCLLISFSLSLHKKIPFFLTNPVLDQLHSVCTIIFFQSTLFP